MPRAIWSGPISFGLVNIPVSLFPAARSKTLSFHQLHSEDDTPIRYAKVCPADGKELAREDIVLGYEFEKGRYVVMDDTDFEAARVAKGRSIDILNFVKLEEVDPIYYQKSYYLAPEETSVKPFRLLHEAMRRQQKAALARFTFHEKQHMSIIRPEGGALLLETLFWHDEVRRPEEMPFSGEKAGLDHDELELAEGLVERMTRALDLAAFRDEYREELLRIIDQKVAGKQIKVPKLEPLAPVVDIMDALRQSIARQEQEGGGEAGGGGAPPQEKAS